ncbi:MULTISPECIES: hypothetical protein, partial [unclassified Sporosarcina]|uniref:hypothetical protein n=1 Tax=unclassified Sporosarcina TaxID=2647733 RepID=UPI00203F07D5
MESIELTLANYLKSFEDILGLSLIIKNDNISAVNLPTAILKINPKSINHVIKPLERIFIEEKENIGDSREPFLYKNILITKYIYSLIDKKNKYFLLDSFINMLQVISDRSYEQQLCQMSFILFKEHDDNINDELSKLGIDYLPFDSPYSINEIDKNKQSLKIIDSLSLSYVVDSSYTIVGLAKKRKKEKSISAIMADQHRLAEELQFKLSMYQYFIEFNSKNELKLVIEQKKEKLNLLEEQYITLKSTDTDELIIEELGQQIDETYEQLILALEEENRALTDWLKGYNTIKANSHKIKKNNIQFIQIGSGKIEWFINQSLVCILSNGKWRIKNYELINHIILEFLLRQYPSKENIESEEYIKVLDQITPRAKILYNNIKQLSNKNIGAL